MLSFGIDSALPLSIASRRRGFIAGSPPPILAATVISLISLVKILPRLASWRPLRCWMLAHFECPAMSVPTQIDSRRFYTVASTLRFGVDLGGTKIELIALDAGGREVLRRRVPTPQGDYLATVAAVAALVHQAEADLGQSGSIGIGVGGGVVVQGRLLRGDNAIAGEWGHSPLPYFQFAHTQADRASTGQHPATGEALLHPWPTPRELDAAPACYCGKKGCIETWLSGPALAADHVRYGGEELPAHEIVQLANAGYGPCSATLARYEERLARALAGAINLIDPDVIVLGGGLSNIGRLYDTVPRLWPRYVFSDRVDTRLVPPKHGDSSGVRGAAWLWSD